jgi:hypothetical protein
MEYPAFSFVVGSILGIIIWVLVSAALRRFTLTFTWVITLASSGLYLNFTYIVSTPMISKFIFIVIGGSAIVAGIDGYVRSRKKFLANYKKGPK